MVFSWCYWFAVVLVLLLFNQDFCIAIVTFSQFSFKSVLDIWSCVFPRIS